MNKPEVSARIVEALKTSPMTRDQMVAAVSAGRASVWDALKKLESMGVIRKAGCIRVSRRGPQARLWERSLVPMPIKASKTFQSRPDGNYALCKQCEKMGYGEDAWQPATAEFWPTENRRLNYDRCRACISEMKVNAHGVVPGRVAA